MEVIFSKFMGKKVWSLLIILTMILVIAVPGSLQIKAEENSNIVFDKAYITSYDTGVVDVVNLKDHSVQKGKIEVGKEPNSAAISPDGKAVYVTNRASNSVSIIDPVTDTVIKTLDVGDGPHGVAFNRDGSRAYVANRFDGTLSIIDTSELEVINTISIPGAPTALVVAGDNLYVTRQYSEEISVVNMISDTVIDEIYVGVGAYGISVNPARTKLYVAMQHYSGSVSVIDLADHSVSATIWVQSMPTATEVSPDGSKVYVVNSFSHSVSVIDAENNTVTSTISIGSYNYPYVIGVSRDGKHIYTVNYASDDLSVIDAETNTVIETISVSPGPFMVGTFMLTTAVAGDIDDDPDDDTDQNMDAVMWLPPVNLEKFSVNNGSTLPIKFTLLDSEGMPLNSEQNVQIVIKDSTGEQVVHYTDPEFVAEDTYWFYQVNLHTSHFALNLGVYTIDVLNGQDDIIGSQEFTLTVPKRTRR